MTYLARQLAVRDVKLHEHVARRQHHFVEVCRIPSCHDNAPRLWIGLDGVDGLCKLVDAFTSVVGVHVRVLGAVMPPLEAVNRSKIADLF